MELKYYGIASANGIESFIEDKTYINKTTKLGSHFGDAIFGHDENEKMLKEMRTMINMMCVTARANAHRRCVVYEAIISPELADEIEELKKRGEYVKALKVLKNKAKDISLAKSVTLAKKFWEQIPNKKLDPYS